MREIKLQINDRTYKFMSNARTFGELTSEINSKYESVNNMRAFEGYTRMYYSDSSSILPESVEDFNGTSTTSLLFMFDEAKKISSAGILDDIQKSKRSDIVTLEPDHLSDVEIRLLNLEKRVAAIENELDMCDYCGDDESSDDDFTIANNLRNGR